jgi:hypothetical protein
MAAHFCLCEVKGKKVGGPILRVLASKREQREREREKERKDKKKHRASHWVM